MAEGKESGPAGQVGIRSRRQCRFPRWTKRRRSRATMPKDVLDAYPPAIICLAVGLLISSPIAFADECQNFRDKEYAAPNSSKVSPFVFEHAVGRLSPTEIFRATSGYYCNFPNNHPTLYGHSGNAVTVVGGGYEKTFPLTKLNEAFAAYMRLLSRQGYFE